MSQNGHKNHCLPVVSRPTKNPITSLTFRKTLLSQFETFPFFLSEYTNIPDFFVRFISCFTFHVIKKCIIKCFINKYMNWTSVFKSNQTKRNWTVSLEDWGYTHNCSLHSDLWQIALTNNLLVTPKVLAIDYTMIHKSYFSKYLNVALKKSHSEKLFSISRSYLG